MRLIDADKLLQGYEDHDFIDTHVIWNAPTVDAIPITFIEEMKTWAEENGSAEYADYLTHLLSVWAERK